jgi:hypothetical protein
MDPVAPEGGPAGNVRVRCGGGRQVRLWIRWRQPMVVRRHPVAPGQGRSCGFGQFFNFNFFLNYFYK